MARLNLFIGWSLESVTPTNFDCKNKVDLTGCAEDIFLAREAHLVATMPDNLRVTHKRNDEVMERIYIGRRFKNDIERLEKLFALYM